MQDEGIPPFRRRLFLLHCLAVVAVIRGGLTFGRFRVVSDHIAAMPVGGPAPVQILRRVSWGVTATARLVPGATCLTQALAGQYLLARHGYKAQIHLGVERGSLARIRAHAWLVSGDCIVLGGSASSLAGYNQLHVIG